jgi:penicillin amidase
MSEIPQRGRGRRIVRRAALTLGVSAGLLAAAGTGGGLWLNSRLEENLPRLDGRQPVSGLAAPAAIERDALGIPTLTGASRRDVAFATGFAHAQDRFFQMDLLRRRSAGELAELLGERALDEDRSLRVHLFRRQAQRVLAASPPEVRALLEAYAQGVNSGLASLGAPPFEYALLRSEPHSWKPEDSVLVLLAMFTQLEDVNGRVESDVSLMRDLLPGPLADFLLAEGTEWDAPLEGQAYASPPVPPAAAVDVRDLARAADLAVPPLPARTAAARSARRAIPGSNSWAVAGGATASGGALLADELHLSLGVPNLWYRASFSWPDSSGRQRRLTGATLPGIPAVVVGSNGRVAWGVTNSVVDTNDLVLLDIDPRRLNFYRTPQGWQAFERHDEILRVRGGEGEKLPVDWTVWGPVCRPSTSWLPMPPGVSAGRSSDGCLGALAATATRPAPGRTAPIVGRAC